jgi:Domain of unknown function (DUF4386)
MMEPIAEASPRFKARIAGVFYLLTFLTGGAALSVSGKLVVSGDAAVTAANILAHGPRFWLGFTFNLLLIACYLAVTALFYELFKPVNRSLSLLAAFFSLVGCAIQAFAFVFYSAPWAVLRGAPYLSVFKVEQQQALALTFVRLNVQAYDIGLVFFGFYCLLIGYLIFRSTFLPRLLGAGMMFAGLGWLTFLFPPLAGYLSPYILLPGLLGEGSLTLWLLAFGVNDQRWKEQANAAGERQVAASRAQVTKLE